jgi:hypothetical protein
MGAGAGLILGFKISPTNVPKWVLELSQYRASKSIQKMLQSLSWTWANFGPQNKPNKYSKIGAGTEPILCPKTAPQLLENES